MMCGVRFFTRVVKPDLAPSIEGAPSVQSETMWFHDILFCWKKWSIFSRASTTLVVVSKLLHVKNSSFNSPACKYRQYTNKYAQFDTSVDSSSWILIFALLARISSATWFKISCDKSLIRQRTVSFDKPIFSSFLFCSTPQTSSTISIAHGLISCSSIVCGFFFFAIL